MKSIVAFAVLLAIATTANAFLVQRDVEVIKSMMVSMPGLTRPELNYKWDPKHPEQACSWKAVVCYPEDPNGAQEIYRLYAIDFHPNSAQYCY